MVWVFLHCAGHSSHSFQPGKSCSAVFMNLFPFPFFLLFCVCARMKIIHSLSLCVSALFLPSLLSIPPSTLPFTLISRFLSWFPFYFLGASFPHMAPLFLSSDFLEHMTSLLKHWHHSLVFGIFRLLLSFGGRMQSQIWRGFVWFSPHCSSELHSSVYFSLPHVKDFPRGPGEGDCPFTFSFIYNLPFKFIYFENVLDEHNVFSSYLSLCFHSHFFCVTTHTHTHTPLTNTWPLPS